LKPGDLTLIANTSDGYIYENSRALPRVIFATDWMPANFERIVTDGRWPEFDPTRTVLLEKAPSQSPLSQALTQHLRPVEAKIALQTYHNTEVEVEVDAPRPGFLVLNDVWHPWWFGTVDGKSAEIFRANVVFRAIEVPAGKHIVRFEFRPVLGAVHEVMASLKGRPSQPIPAFPNELRARPEANARGSGNSASEELETLR
jgi:hypothetical protein